MDYNAMAQRLAQFRQAQVPGGGQRPMNSYGQGLQGMMGQLGQRFQGMMPTGAVPQQAQGAFNQAQGMIPQASGLAGAALQSQGRPNPYMTHPGQSPMAVYKNRGGMGGGFGGA